MKDENAVEPNDGSEEPQHAGNHQDTWVGSIFKRWDDTLKYVALFFATFELIPKRGAWAPAVLAVILVLFWVGNKRHTLIRREWKSGKDIIRQWQLWWQPVLAITILLVTCTAVYLGTLHITIGRPSYLFAHTSLSINDRGWAHENFYEAESRSDTTPRDRNMRHLLAWKSWMSSGVFPEESLSWIKSERFDDNYADFKAILTINQGYFIDNPVAFLVYDEPRFANDPHYRPQLRQMQIIETPGRNRIIIELLRPNKGEYLEVFCQVIRRSDNEPVLISNLIVSDTFEVR